MTDKILHFSPRPEAERSVIRKHPEPRSCRHDVFHVDERHGEVVCGDCGEKLNPIWALLQVAQQESHYLRMHKRYTEEVKRLSERSRTKCQHCGHVTRISDH